MPEGVDKTNQFQQLSMDFLQASQAAAAAAVPASILGDDDELDADMQA